MNGIEALKANLAFLRKTCEKPGVQWIPGFDDEYDTESVSKQLRDLKERYFALEHEKQEAERQVKRLTERMNEAAEARRQAEVRTKEAIAQKQALQDEVRAYERGLVDQDQRARSLVAEAEADRDAAQGRADAAELEALRIAEELAAANARCAALEEDVEQRKRAAALAWAARNRDVGQQKHARAARDGAARGGRGRGRGRARGYRARGSCGGDAP